jgi:hypothetical protein
MGHRRRGQGRRGQSRRAGELPEPKDHWFYFGDYRMFVVGCTPSGTPYGAIESLDGEPAAFEFGGEDEPF